MSAVLLRLRAELRRDRRAWLTGALLLGLLAGVVIATAASARRTDTALARWRAHTETMDVWVGRGELWGIEIDLDRVERLPQVAQSVRSIDVGFWARTDRGRTITVDDAELNAPVDGLDGGKNHAIYLEGRAPDTRRPEEIYVGMRAAKAYGLRVGSTITVRFTTPRELADIAETGVYDTDAPPQTAGKGLLLELRVVGLTADIQSESALQWMSMSRAFMEAHGREISAWTELSGIRLRRGDRDLAAFRAGVERIAGGGAVALFEQRSLTAELAGSIRLQVRGLWALAVLGGLATLLLVAQTVSRRTARMATDQRVLGTLGMTRAALLTLGVLRFAVPAVLAAIIAVGVAVALSPLAPFGAARIAEPDPGLAADPLLLCAGGAIVLLLTLLAAAPSAFRTSRSRPAAPPRRSAVVRLLYRHGMSLTGAEGARMALERARGRTPAPVVSTLAVGVVAVTVVVAGFTVTMSVDRLLATPRLYGQSFDAVIGDGTQPETPERVVARLRADPSITQLSMGAVAEVRVDGKPMDALAVDVVRGSLGPVVLEGRAPADAGEILLGSGTAKRLRKGVGDDVVARIGGRRGTLRVVGRGVLPEFGQAGALTLGLGSGAAITYQRLRLLDPGAVRNVFLLGLDGREATLPRLRREEGAAVPTPPAEVGNWGGARSFPLIAILLVSAAAAAILAQALVTSIRLRGREVAILKTLGFERRDVRATVAWYATTVAAVALLAGLPLGVATGRFAWRLAAEELGVVPEAAMEWATLLVIPATLLLANLVAVPPGWIAARAPSALALRTE